MTLKELFEKGKTTLKDITYEYETDAWLLLERVTGCTRFQYLTYPDTEIGSDKCDEYMAMLAKRVRHIPLQHIIGSQEFMGLEFKVNEHVLIPRQDTECLVEEAIRQLGKVNSNCEADAKVLDMCTGSGCIIISIAKNVQLKKAVAVDISKEALDVARVNALYNEADICFVQSNLFENVEDEKYDMIVSNPPYIESEVIEGLMPEVKEHEPRIALDGGEDGLIFYRKIIEDAKQYLVSGGYLIFEIGHNQREAVCNLFCENGYVDVKAMKDLAGLDRVCMARLA
ncbi:MAG: peptide chain release factor N(5)-glutamine methyltransferase [Lachnospiraceae bacterium]|nr:peptide chain release factor N(5)-glutamine methyltransferase [Lachnospiraceae bacterium]